ncbi:MAG: hypothetical protein Harvfovirus71_4 [Harvfovirus sp.]|uniref:Uncharacterized protein n=1 Tax=Harvfovirus sp. TaxID=2487768 RepID=A0A3G5A933_9VIRU|nr:MAG: hypothetical protein Harvfovirus71_4 [Harvfovirus sp.]
MSLQQIFDWPEWEAIGRIALALIFIYVIILFSFHPQERTLTNWLLFALVIAFITMVQQFSNHDKNRNATFFS